MKPTAQRNASGSRGWSPLMRNSEPVSPSGRSGAAAVVVWGVLVVVWGLLVVVQPCGCNYLSNGGLSRERE